MNFHFFNQYNETKDDILVALQGYFTRIGKELKADNDLFRNINALIINEFQKVEDIKNIIIEQGDENKQNFKNLQEKSEDIYQITSEM